MAVDALIKELLATGSMNEDTTADLNRHALKRLFGGMQVAAVIIDEDSKHLGPSGMHEGTEPPAGIFRNR